MDGNFIEDEQRKVYVALSALVASLVQSTPLKECLVNMPQIRSEVADIEPRKYRPGQQLAVGPLDLNF